MISSAGSEKQTMANTSTSGEKRPNTQHIASATTPSEYVVSEEFNCSKEGLARSPRDMNPLVWATVVVSLLCSMLLFSLDNVIVADIQPSIIHTLGHIEKLPWVSVGYALGATAVNLFVARLFALFNNKHLFVTGVAIFEVGSAICGAAPNMTALIFGRVICGVGCTGLYLGTINLLSVLTTESERPLYVSFTGLTWGIGTILGPVIGGALADGAASWRWCFYLNLIVGAVVIPVYLLFIPSYDPRPGMKLKARLSEIDWLGSILFGGIYLSLITGLSFGGSVYAWNNTRIIAVFVVSGTLLIAITLQQIFAFCTTEENRLIPFSMLQSREMLILYVQIATSISIIYVPMYFIPLFFQFVQDQSALRAAVHLLPFVVMSVTGTVLSGALMGKFGYYMLWYLTGGAISLIGGSMLYVTTNTATSASAIYGYSVLCGLGSGLFSQITFAVAQAKVVKSAIPLAVAFIGWGQITGIVMSLTISNAIFLNQATNRISAVLPLASRASVQNAISGADSTLLSQLTAGEKVRVLEAIVQSIKNVYPMVIAAGAVTVILSLCMKHERIFDKPSKVSAQIDTQA